MKEMLGDVLKKRREAMNLSQRQLSRNLGVKPSYIGYLERDMRRPSLRLLDRIAEVLGLERRRLLLLAHPEARKLLDERATGRRSDRGAWQDFVADRPLLARYRVTPAELRVLAKVNLLGRVSSPRNFLFILQSIRQALDD